MPHRKVLKKAGLPTELSYNKDEVCSAMLHDKKFSGKKITIIRVDTVGEFVMQEISASDLEKIVKE